MINSRRFALAVFVFFALACPTLAAPDPGKKALKEFFGKIRELSLSGNTTELVKVARSLFPDRESIEKGLSAHVPGVAIEKLTKWHEEARESSDEEMINAFTLAAGESEITVHSATVASLIASDKDSDAYRYFPRGAQFFAHDSTLRDDTTYYLVFIKDPDKEPFRQFHLVFWDGQGWRTLGAIWNLLEAETPLFPPPLGAPAKDQRKHLKELKERLLVYQETEKKAEADLAQAMAESKQDLALPAIQELIGRSLVASKLLLAMQVKIPKLEERITRQNIKVAMSGGDPGKPIETGSEKPAARPNPAITPTTPLELLKRELRFLWIAKSLSVKALKDPESLTREELIRHTKRLLELDELIAAKERKIEAAELASKEPAKK